MRRSAPLECLALLLLAFVAGGCNCGGTPSAPPLGDGGIRDGGPPPSIRSIAISPGNPTLTFDGSTPAQVSFTVTATYTDETTEDVTAQATFAIADDGLGYFSGPQFTSRDRGGISTVTATVGALQDTTQLSVKDQQSFQGPGTLPADPSGPFQGSPDAARAPTLLYPNDGVLLPPNLGRLEFHFLPGAGNDLFRLTFSNSVTNVSVYLGCDQAFTQAAGWGSFGGGCIYTPDAAVWKALAETNRGGEPVQVTVAGTTADGKSGVGTSAPISLSFAYENLNGGLYYWTTSGSTAIMRYDFAGSQTQASKLFGPEATAPTAVSCVGCHALSRDGKKLVAEVNGQNDGRLLLWDVADGGPLVSFPTPGESIFESWNVDGTRFVGVDGDNGNYALRLYDGETGAFLSAIPGTGDSNHWADHPDWSADGQMIAFVKVGANQTDQRPFEGAIEIIRKQADGGWSAPTELIPQVSWVNHYYPAIAPDGTFLVYDESRCNGQAHDFWCDADTDPTASLWAVSTDGGTPIEMVRANTPGPLDRLSDGGVQTQLTDSFPKWSPFVTRRSASDPNAKVMWLTFSSTRQFGLRSPPIKTGNLDEALLGVETFVWMVAVDPSKIGSGQDPSYPAFVLPFQDFSTSNHIAQWTTKVVGGQCIPFGSACDVGGTPCCQDQGAVSCIASQPDGPTKCTPSIN